MSRFTIRARMRSLLAGGLLALGLIGGALGAPDTTNAHTMVDCDEEFAAFRLPLGDDRCAPEPGGAPVFNLFVDVSGDPGALEMHPLFCEGLDEEIRRLPPDEEFCTPELAPYPGRH